jgi:hypothetical protein
MANIKQNIIDEIDSKIDVWIKNRVKSKTAGCNAEEDQKFYFALFKYEGTLLEAVLSLDKKSNIYKISKKHIMDCRFNALNRIKKIDY